VADDIPQLINASMKSKVKHMIVPIGRTLGGLYNHTKAVSNFDIPSKDSLERGILDIGIVHEPSSEVRLRIWMDGISLAKEFRPNFSLSVDGSIFSSILIDVSPLLKREAARARSRIVVLNNGSSPFFVTHTSMFALFEGGSEKKVIYPGGGMPLAGGDSREFRLDDDKYTLVKFNGVFVARDPPHSFEVLLNDKVARALDIIRKAEDVELAFNAPEIRGIALRRLKDLLGKKKGHTILASMSIVASREEEREMELEAHVRRAEDGDVVVLAKVKNLTGRTMKRVSLIGLASGMVVNREFIGELMPYAEVSREMRAKTPKDSKSYILRLIWNDGGETKYIEKRFKERSRQ